MSYYLTTVDNPFDPSKDFVSWYLFDVSKGYNSCELLSLHARTSEALTDQENEEEIKRAIDEIVDEDPTGLYIKLEVED